MCRLTPASAAGVRRGWRGAGFCCLFARLSPPIGVKQSHVEPSNSLPPSLRLLVVGLNHKTAPLALRETVAFNPAQTAAATQKFREQFPQAELVILSTCNRVEFYIARPIAGEPNLE